MPKNTHKKCANNKGAQSQYLRDKAKSDKTKERAHNYEVLVKSIPNNEELVDALLGPYRQRAGYWGGNNYTCRHCISDWDCDDAFGMMTQEEFLRHIPLHKSTDALNPEFEEAMLEWDYPVGKLGEGNRKKPKDGVFIK